MLPTKMKILRTDLTQLATWYINSVTPSALLMFIPLTIKQFFSSNDYSVYQSKIKWETVFSTSFDEVVVCLQLKSIQGLAGGSNCI